MAKRKEFPDVATKSFQEGYESEPEVPVEAPFDEKTLPRQTYYLTPLQLEAVSVMSHEEFKGKSELIREMLDKYIPPKYLEEAARRLEKQRKSRRQP